MTGLEETVINNINRLLKLNKMSRKSLARAIGIPEVSLDAVIHGNMKLSLDLIQKICLVFNISAPELMTQNFIGTDSLIKSLESLKGGSELLGVIVSQLEGTIKGISEINPTDEELRERYSVIGNSDISIDSWNQRKIKYYSNADDEVFLRSFCRRIARSGKYDVIDIYYTFIEKGDSDNRLLARLIYNRENKKSEFQYKGSHPQKKAASR